jgi:kynureninase
MGTSSYAPTHIYTASESRVVYQTAEAYAKEQDALDPLAPYRERFYIPHGTIYLDGNSLGLLSRDAEEEIEAVLRDWKSQAIDGWMQAKGENWITYVESLSPALARLMGANPEEVIATGSTTLNLHQLLSTLYAPTKPQKSILTEGGIFPSTSYALQSHLRLHHLEPSLFLKRVPVDESHLLDEEAFIRAMTDEVQIVVLSAVLYKSGQLLNMEKLTTAAHERGILIGFDCAHSVGSIPHHLHDWEVDFAFWCHYKHLNSGPGAVGGLFLHSKHHASTPGIAGWFGNRRGTQFELELHFDPEQGAAGLQIGTTHLLSLAPLRGSLRHFDAAGMNAVRQKSLALTRFLRSLLKEIPEMRLITPAEDNQRGGHLTYMHPSALALTERLIERGIIIDFRPPNLLRFAPVALYNTFAECVQTAKILKEVV